MYRIEVASGEATVFRTIEELATGIRNGLITPRSRIWHGASQKWLPIDIHPHYRKALDLVTGGAPMIDTGLTPPPRRTPVPAPAPAPTPAPAPAPAAGSVPAASPPRTAGPPTSPWAPPPRPPSPPSPRSPTNSSPKEPRVVALPPWPAQFAPALPAPSGGEPAPSPSGDLRYPDPFGDGTPALPPALPPASEPAPFEPPARRESYLPMVEELGTAAATATATPTATEEVSLPRVSYPEIPAPSPDEFLHPRARRRPGRRTSMVIAGIVALALLGGYFLVGSRTAPPDAAAEAEVAPAAEPAATTESEFGGEAAFPDGTSQPAAAAAPAEPPATLTPLPHPAGPVSQAWSSSAGAVAPVAPVSVAPTAPEPTTDTAVISPPPARIDLSLPRLPRAETVGVPAEAKRDSATLKRILRAVSGDKSTP